MSGRKPKKKASPSGKSTDRKGNVSARETSLHVLFDAAAQTPNLDDRQSLYSRILELDPDNYYALIGMSKSAKYIKDAVPYVRRAFEIVEAAIGDIQKYAGRLNDSEIAMKYINARGLLALALMKAGAWDEGAKHAYELLKLEPDEEFGVHFMFINESILQRKWDLADFVMSKCPDQNTRCKPYIRALLEFRRHGASDAALGELKAAIARNPHVIPLLLNPEPRFIGSALDGIPHDSKDEAQEYVQNCRATWQSISGSMSWLRKASSQLQPAAGGAAKKIEPPQALKNEPLANKEEMVSLHLEAKRLPRHQDETWLVDVAQMSDGTWLLLVLDSLELNPFLTEEFDTKPIQDDLLWHLYLCMVEPEDESEPHRPAQVEFIREEVLAEFGPKLRSIGIDAAMREDAEVLIDHFARMDRTKPLPDEPLTSLPQVPRERWEIDWRQLATWMTDESGDSIQPWIIIVVEPKSEMVLNVEPLTEEPTQEQIIAAIRTAAFRPAVGDARRPNIVRVASGDQKMVIANWLSEAGIDCEVGRFKLLDATVEDLAKSIFGTKRAGLSESEDIPLKLIGEFYEHSAAYYRSSPWDWMNPTDLTEMSCPALSARSWIAVGMGQLGEGLGIMLFDNVKNLKKVFTLEEDTDHESGADYMQGLSVSLEEKVAASPADVAAAEQFGWPVAAQDAWPVAARVQGREGFDAVDQQELQVLIAALQIVPKFWKGAVRGRVKPADIALTIGGKSVVVKTRQFML